MAPSRTKRERPHKISSDDDVLPGVQRLKSALRQTKRLLAKDKVAANVRVETERRSRALEADLARAEQSRKERLYATKYHKIKFFERKKIIRKINQVKRSIATLEGKEKRELESTLADLRVDLNYVLHFPKTKKYVSLFPPEVRKSGSAAVPVVASSDDNEERSKLREMIHQQMKHGELSAEPENELGKPGQRVTRLMSSARRGADAAPSNNNPPSSVAGDDFFGDEDEGGSQQSEISDP